MALPKKNRIKKQKDFDYLFQQGKTVKNSFFLLKFKKNSLPFFRTAVVVSSKVSKRATDRNAIRRRIQEAIRSSVLPTTPFDVVVMPSHQAQSASFYEIREQLNKILREAHII